MRPGQEAPDERDRYVPAAGDGDASMRPGQEAPDEGSKPVSTSTP